MSEIENYVPDNGDGEHNVIHEHVCLSSCWNMLNLFGIDTYDKVIKICKALEFDDDVIKCIKPKSDEEWYKISPLTWSKVRKIFNDKWKRRIIKKNGKYRTVLALVQDLIFDILRTIIISKEVGLYWFDVNKKDKHFTFNEEEDLTIDFYVDLPNNKRRIEMKTTSNAYSFGENNGVFQIKDNLYWTTVGRYRSKKDKKSGKWVNFDTSDLDFLFIDISKKKLYLIPCDKIDKFKHAVNLDYIPDCCKITFNSGHDMCKQLKETLKIYYNNGKSNSQSN